MKGSTDLYQTTVFQSTEPEVHNFMMVVDLKVCYEAHAVYLCANEAVNHTAGSNKAWKALASCWVQLSLLITVYSEQGRSTSEFLGRLQLQFLRFVLHLVCSKEVIFVAELLGFLGIGETGCFCERSFRCYKTRLWWTLVTAMDKPSDFKHLDRMMTDISPRLN